MALEHAWRATTERPEFERELEVYRKRWHLAVEEDNGISANQQDGLASPTHKPGPFYVLREFGVHAMNLWLLDQIFPPAAASSAEAAKATSGSND